MGPVYLRGPVSLLALSHLYRALYYHAAVGLFNLYCMAILHLYVIVCPFNLCQTRSELSAAVCAGFEKLNQKLIYTVTGSTV